MRVSTGRVCTSRTASVPVGVSGAAHAPAPSRGAGHLDTVRIADKVPSRRDGDRLVGCGASDMKSGIAVMLKVAASVPDPRYDVTWLFYDNEEVEAARNGLGRVARSQPKWLQGDL